MANERRIRLIQVAKEFNVGINTITDFLQKKGVKSDGSPNELVAPETYDLLEKEFGSGRAAGSERINIRERIAQKQATVSLDDSSKRGGKDDEELLVKSNVISVKEEVAGRGPKILGKIDLPGRRAKVQPVKPRPAVKPAAAAPAAAVPAPAPASVSAPVQAPAPAAPAAAAPVETPVAAAAPVAAPVAAPG